MDLTLACGGDRVAGFGIDLLALGTVALILARKWRASQWRLSRPRPRRPTRAYGLVVFVRVEPPADSDEAWRP